MPFNDDNYQTGHPVLNKDEAKLLKKCSVAEHQLNKRTEFVILNPQAIK